MSQKGPNYDKMMENDRRIAEENNKMALQMKEMELKQQKEFQDRSEQRLNAQEEYNRGQDQKRSDLYNDIVADGKFANDEIKNAYQDSNSWYNKPATMEDMIKNDPTYAYRMNETQEGAMKALNAGGNSIHSGAAAKALMDYTNNFSQSNYDSYWNKQNVEKNQRMGLLQGMSQNGNFGLTGQASALNRTDIGTQLTNIDGSVTNSAITANNNYLQYLMASNSQLNEKQQYYELQKAKQGGGVGGAVHGGLSGFSSGFAATGNPWVGLGTGALGAYAGSQGTSANNTTLLGGLIGSGYQFGQDRADQQNKNNQQNGNYNTTNPFMAFLGRS